MEVKLDSDIEVALLSIKRKQGELVEECLKVWDSMEGELPSFERFVGMYVGEKMGNWIKNGGRWN